MTPAPGSFTAGEVDQLAQYFHANGYAALRGAFDESVLAAAEDELAEAQHQLAEGRLDARHGTVILDEPDATIDGRPFAHYVCFATDAAPRADGLVRHPTVVGVAERLLGNDAWLLDYEQFGVVYQDARPDPGSAYSRIGWHTDHQSGPHLDIWPGAAFTVHFDPTSPANGFLRVLPGSHLGGVEGIPLGFERVPGEIALYQERGDVLFHHSDLWHAAARATAYGGPAIRRHLRGSWHAGTRLEPGHGTADFVKNALR
ncbi:MAG TPA: phytanoyl-CoA dioxygenase family protein [Acidimicrobiales bacterium]|jgi:ectoine hydroxylase-related dioxygenase (phytanoyl-CoA dioxygenase family)|nr:phytanoyl-CoA dioxygenase family protein [Acidimicrobiales bacterium]